MTKLIHDHNVETVTLETPIVRGDSTMDTLTIKQPKTGHLRGLALADLMKLDVDTMIKIIPRITSPVISENEVADLDTADFIKVATAVVGFFAPKEERTKAKL